MPQVRKIDEQHEMEISIYAANKENNKDIFNAESQPFSILNDPVNNENKIKNNVTNTGCLAEGDNKEKLNTPGEEELVDDIDGESKKQGDIPLLVQAINLTKPKENRQLNMKMKRMRYSRRNETCTGGAEDLGHSGEGVFVQHPPVQGPVLPLQDQVSYLRQTASYSSDQETRNTEESFG